MGLGKPNHILNAFYDLMEREPSRRMLLITALTLEKPFWKSDLERRFLEPFVQRVFRDYPDLKHVTAMRKDRLPPNIEVREFYHRPGAFMRVPHAQRHFISTNYTHVLRDVLRLRPNVMAQIVCRHPTEDLLSVGSNPDVSLDVAKSMESVGMKRSDLTFIGQVNPNMPFMYGDAVVQPGTFDMLLDNPSYHHAMFGAPRLPLSLADFMVGLHASTLIRDDGTLQIGFGNLGDAIIYGIEQRHQNNRMYNGLLKDTRILEKFGAVIEESGGTGVFEKGLYGSTEMLVDGYLDLYRCGVMKRKVYEDLTIQGLVNEGRLTEALDASSLDLLVERGAVNARLNASDVAYLRRFGILDKGWEYEDGYLTRGGERMPADLSDLEARRQVAQRCLGDRLQDGVLVHAGFFIGSNQFYDTLRSMDEEERKQFRMTSVLNVNQLYACPYASQELKTIQRRNGRFANTAMMVTLSGAVVSDGLENGVVVSGVGGQYNFVEMAHALPDARSIIMLRSTRISGKRVSSNILWNYGHTTIARHLRDIVVTEYGIADLRGRPDWEVSTTLINIADSRFQERLLRRAKRAGKVPADYRIPDAFRANLPERLEKETAYYRKNGMFPSLPFGTDFTPEELVLGKALKDLKRQLGSGLVPMPKFGALFRSFSPPAAAQPYLERMGLDKPSNFRESMLQKVITYALICSGKV